MTGFERSPLFPRVHVVPVDQVQASEECNWAGLLSPSAIGFCERLCLNVGTALLFGRRRLVNALQVDSFSVPYP
jgi:hypothetical protein